MVDPAPKKQSRRQLLAAAAGGAAALALRELAHPAAASATTGAMQYGSDNNAGSSSTTLDSLSPSWTFAVFNAGGGEGVHVDVSGVATIAVNGISTGGYGVVGSTGEVVQGRTGVWGRDYADGDVGPAVGTAGTSVNGTGVVGYVAGDSPYVVPPLAGEKTGVYGYAPTGTGVRARSDTGFALKVTGRAAFSRSGRVTMAAGRSYVDVTVPGGLGGTPLCFANLMTRRAGVHVEAVRANYPSTGRIRIYLNKVATTSGNTYISWIVMG